MEIVLTQFARGRLFDPGPGRTGIVGPDADRFEADCNARPPLEDREGYAPFCRLHVHDNWTHTPCQTLPITADNRGHLRSDYEARTSDELPVLVRWFEGIEAPKASFLQVILYSAEQLLREGEDIGPARWGIVGCLATTTREEPPMAPITMMRNALGVDEGGSGVPLDPDAYRRAVEYWSRHANVRPPKVS